jgi:hypothetical protein
VVSETYFAIPRHYAVPKEQALRQLKALFESGDLVPAGCAAQVSATLRPSLRTGIIR